MANLVTKINAIFERNGYRLTASRKAIVEVLVKSAGHITADDLALQVRDFAPNVGRMSVYRTLEVLTELGVVRPIYQGTGAAHYILMTDGSHHHLMCNRCHTVIEFDDCFADEAQLALAQQLASKFNFHISSHLLELHGFCAACQGANNAEK